MLDLKNILLISDFLWRKISLNFQKQLFLEVIYNEPRDSKLYTQPGIDPDDSLKYKLYVGNESFYCKPLSCQTNYPNYEQIQNPGKNIVTVFDRNIVRYILIL